MDAFDDENPFDTESDRISSETSSTSKVNLSEPPSPPFNPSRQLSSEIINSDRPFLHGSHRQQSHSNNKIDFCCARDRVLHSGDDIEILVRGILLDCHSFANVLLTQITDAQKTSVGATSPYITYVIQTGVSCSLCYLDITFLPSRAEHGIETSILGIRVSEIQSSETLPYSHSPTYTVQADYWRLRSQAGQG